MPHQAPKTPLRKTRRPPLPIAQCRAKRIAPIVPWPITLSTLYLWYSASVKDVLGNIHDISWYARPIPKIGPTSWRAIIDHAGFHLVANIIYNQSTRLMTLAFTVSQGSTYLHTNTATNQLLPMSRPVNHYQEDWTFTIPSFPNNRPAQAQVWE